MQEVRNRIRDWGDAARCNEVGPEDKEIILPDMQGKRVEVLFIYRQKEMIERNEQIIKLWNENKSATEIAKEVLVTRNTVIGVITRARPLGVITRPMMVEQAKRGRDGSERKKQKNPRTVVINRVFPMQIIEEQNPEIIGVSLFEIAHNGCRFPTSRFEDQHYFCGKAKRDSKTSFCSEHHQVVWLKPRRVGPSHSANERRPFSLRKLA